ncbi:MAG TPA: Gfo/Idh/MocA family oxidoreductase [Gemmataceae bacterium]|nr:Gfo/Idh/MocA family oxidoreductase [Gemmataceae bacterium]
MKQMHRREFLGASAAAAAGLAAPLALAKDKTVSANEKLVVALIGCGGMGRYDLSDFIRLPEVEVAALCDPDPEHIKAAVQVLEKGKRPTDKVRTEKDFRKVVERKDIDAVIVGTPDHWHPYILIAACAHGKDVYCEKPISHNIVEGRAMVNAARKYKRVVQIGTQQRSGKHFQDAVAFVRSGKLGPVGLCRTWIANSSGREGAGNPPDSDPPAGVDYDLWQGPAPKRPFNRNRFHYNFRWFWDYGNGLCNDWGVHLNDLILWGMNVSAPLSVFATGGRHDIKDNSDTPDTLDVHYQYPGFTHIYTVRRGHYHYGAPDHGHGMEFQGAWGVLTLDREGWLVRADGDQVTAEKHGTSDQHFPHVQDFVHCVRNRDDKPRSDIEAMHRATTTCHLANISFKVGRRVYWDAENERCYRGYDAETKKFLHEDTDANAYLLREPRKPWSLAL